MGFFWCISIALFFTTISSCSSLTPSTYLTVADVARMKKVFINALTLTDLPSTHYAVQGLSLLKEPIPTSEAACKYINSKVEKNLESIFHASCCAKLLGNCKVSSSGLQQFLEGALTAEAPLQDIYYAVLSMKNLNINVDSAKVIKVVAGALKKDDSVWNLGYAFQVASKLQGDLGQFFDRIEDVIVQADEVDGKYLQFEGGLVVTSTTISGVYNLAEVVKKSPTLTSDQAVKFTNYFLSRKFVQTVKGAAHLLAVLNILSTNSFHVPVSMTLASSSALSVRNPNVQVRVTDVLGKSLGALTVTVDSARRLSDDSAVLTKKPFQPIKGSSTLYSFNFMEYKPLRGFYKLIVSAVPTKPDSRLVGNTGAEIDVKVMTEVNVESIEIGTADRDQATAGKSTSVTFPNQLSKKLEADFHQKVFMKFSLKDISAKSVVNAHQTFVHFSNPHQKQEVVFVSEPDSSNNYRFDLDINAKAKDFGYVSGEYDINLIVGDAVILNPFMWKVGQIHLTFPNNPNPPKPVENHFVPKPEIKHLFREQEKRPSILVSNTFSVLMLVPLLLLFILWFRLGANLYNFQFSLAAFGFHLGLGAIFGLFTCFWLHLNMFDTLKYLCGIGVFTFLTGHRLLSRISQSRKL